MANAEMTIGALAKAADVHVETVRYYQQLGLLALPKRPAGQIRRYGEETLRRLQFIRRAQRLGFSLDEVHLLLGLADGAHCAETKTLAEKKLKIVDQKLTDLQAMRSTLRRLVTQCSRGSRGTGCPIIDALSDNAAL